jgi:hypothetical protein
VLSSDNAAWQTLSFAALHKIGMSDCLRLLAYIQKRKNGGGIPPPLQSEAKILGFSLFRFYNLAINDTL